MDRNTWLETSCAYLHIFIIHSQHFTHLNIYLCKPGYFWHCLLFTLDIPAFQYPKMITWLRMENCKNKLSLAEPGNI